MKIIYIIAGTIEEFNQYCADHLDGNNYWFVYDPDSFGSLENPDGLFIGTWHKHPYIYSIMDELWKLCKILKKKQTLHQIKEILHERTKA